MKATIPRKVLLSAFQAVNTVVPAKSPKPILQSIKLDIGEKSWLMATDLEVGIRHRVQGVKSDEPFAVMLPTARIGQILSTSIDDELDIAINNDVVTIRGKGSKFTFPTEDASLFPEVPHFDATSHYVVTADDLKRLIKRTIFATDGQSTKYALGGVLIELGRESASMVGTDGRRLAKQTTMCDFVGDPLKPSGSPVVPVKALKLIDRNLDDDDPEVDITIQDEKSIMVRTADAVIWSRLVEGRFPRYQDVFPSTAEVKIPLVVKDLKSAIDQSVIVTSEESRGVDFTFSAGVLKLASQGNGKSIVEMGLDYQGKTVDITFDPRYVADALKTMSDDAIVTAELIDFKNAALFTTTDGYAYVVMPLTRDRS